LDSFNKISKVLINELPNAFPPYKKVDRKIEVVLGLILSSKAPKGSRKVQKIIKQPIQLKVYSAKKVTIWAAYFVCG
jgi:hypothetical protein